MSSITLIKKEGEAAALDTSSIKIELTPDALQARKQVLVACGKIQDINTAEDMELANPVLRLLKSTLKDMEESRAAAKKPITKLGKEIDAVANDYKDPLEKEELRLKGLVAKFIEWQRESQISDIRNNGETEICASAGSGIATVEEWDFEIDDMHKAYLANPGLFTLTPNRAAIVGAGKLGIALKHIKVFKKTGVRVTS